MFRAARDQNLRRRELDRVLAVKFLGDRLEQLGYSLVGGVLGEILLNRPDCRILDQLGSREVGFAGCEAHDVDSFRLEPPGPRREKLGLRLFEQCNHSGNRFHVPAIWMWIWKVESYARVSLAQPAERNRSRRRRVGQFHERYWNSDTYTLHLA